MTGPRVRSFIAALALALAPAAGVAQDDTDPSLPEPRPVAEQTPAFRAPADLPDKDVFEPPAVDEPEGPLHLRDALALALMGNSDLQVFSWDVRASEARALQAAQPDNPELDFRLVDRGIEDRPEDGRLRVILSQEFRLGGKRRKGYALARTDSVLAGWNYEARRIEVATVTAGRFVSVLGAQRQAETLGRFAEELDRMREVVAALVESGSLRSLEVHQIKRQAGLARIELQRAEFELESARFRLAAMWGSQSPRFAEAVGDLEEVVPIPDIESVIEQAQQSPSILRWDAELARSEAALKLANAGKIPDLQFGAGIRWDDDSSGRDYIVDLEITLPVFDRKQGDRREARYGMERARAGHKAAEAVSAERIAEFYYVLAEARARRLTLSEEVVPAARAAVEAYRVGFEGNVLSLDDLLDARRDLARAEVAEIDAQVDYHQALATLEGLVGGSLAGGD